MAHYPGNVEKCILVSPGELNHREWENKHRGWPRDQVSQERLQMMKSALGPHFFRYILLELLVDINPGAGHMPYLEKPDLFTNAVSAFLLDRPLPLPAYTGD
jgi:pimeloyl-ACP methyl ester carboxylesterase